MRQLILVLLLGTIGQCCAGTFDLDTIDNWQIYNGSELVLAGHEPLGGGGFHGTIKKSELKDLTVQYNHDALFVDDVTISITNGQGENVLTKRFRTAGAKLTIEKKEFGLMLPDLIIIRYRENRKNGTDRVLGEIKFE